MNIFEAIYENGVLVPQTPAALADGERVLVSVQSLGNAQNGIAKPLPDALLAEAEISPPCELPRPVSSPVEVERTVHRLPDGVII